MHTQLLPTSTGNGWNLALTWRIKLQGWPLASLPYLLVLQYINHFSVWISLFNVKTQDQIILIWVPANFTYFPSSSSTKPFSKSFSIFNFHTPPTHPLLFLKCSTTSSLLCHFNLLPHCPLSTNFPEIKMKTIYFYMKQTELGNVWMCNLLLSEKTKVDAFKCRSHFCAFISYC